MVTGEWRKCHNVGLLVLYNSTKVVGSYRNFHSKQARLLDMWVSGCCQTVKSPWSNDQKSSIPLQQYQQKNVNFKYIALIFTLISKPLTNSW